MDFKELGLTDEQLEVINKAIQSEGDKVRTKYSKELNELKGELKEYKPEKKSDIEKKLEEKQKELELKEKELANKELSYTIKEKLTEKGLPSELAKFINVGDDVDKSIEEFGATLNNVLLDSSFKPSKRNKSDGISKDDFRKMNYTERAKLYDTNPTLYKKLSS